MIDPSKLPYGPHHPAKSLDVVDEIAKLATLISAVFVGAHDPKIALRLIEDTSDEIGKGITNQKARVAIALESWSLEGDTKVLSDMALGLGDGLIQLHDSLHAEESNG